MGNSLFTSCTILTKQELCVGKVGTGAISKLPQPRGEVWGLGWEMGFASIHQLPNLSAISLPPQECDLVSPPSKCDVYFPTSLGGWRALCLL